VAKKRSVSIPSALLAAVVAFVVAVSGIGCGGTAPESAGAGSEASASDIVVAVSHPDRFIAVISAPDSAATPIATAEDLLAVADNPSGSYVLVNDIDVTAISAGSAASLAELGAGSWKPLCAELQTPFTGILDGQGFVITGLYTQAKIGRVAGLFASIGAAGVVRNLGLERSVLAPVTSELIGGIANDNAGLIENCFVAGLLSADASTSGTVYAGGISTMNTGKISDCYFAGTLALNLPDAAYGVAGGIAAHNRGDIAHCFVLGTVASTSDTATVGGIAAVLFAGTVSDCFVGAGVQANAPGQIDVGGICGTFEERESAPGPAVLRCLVTGPLYGETSASVCVGGIGGYARSFGEIRNCVILSSSIWAECPGWKRASWVYSPDDGFWEEGMPTIICEGNLVRDDISGINQMYGAEPISLSQAGDQATYEALGWDFGGVWSFSAGNTLNGYGASSGTWLPAGISGLPWIGVADFSVYQIPDATELLAEMEAALAAAAAAAAGETADGSGSDGADADADAGGHDSKGGESGNNSADATYEQNRPYVSDVEAEVSRIRSIWTADREAIAAGSYEVRSLGNGVTGYYENGVLQNVEVARGTNGLDYLRIFQYDNGTLIFAYYEGVDQNRLYFINDYLFRWRFTSAGGDEVNHDNEPTSQQFLDWERLALTEGNDFR
jgi:hypothetical protein